MKIVFNLKDGQPMISKRKKAYQAISCPIIGSIVFKSLGNRLQANLSALVDIGR